MIGSLAEALSPVHTSHPSASVSQKLLTWLWFQILEAGTFTWRKLGTYRRIGQNRVEDEGWEWQGAGKCTTNGPMAGECELMSCRCAIST